MVRLYIRLHRLQLLNMNLHIDCLQQGLSDFLLLHSIGKNRALFLPQVQLKHLHCNHHYIIQWRWLLWLTITVAQKLKNFAVLKHNHWHPLL